MIDGDDCGTLNGMNEWQEELKYSEDSCPNAAVSTTDSILLDPGLHPDRRGGKPTTNRLT
jgi:hypothetical protein